MIAARIPGLGNCWAFFEDGSELARVHLPAAVTDESGALAWWAAHSHELDPDYVDPGAAWAALRAERDRRLVGCDWMFLRHQCETARGADTTLSEPDWTALLDYRQALRDLPENCADPADPPWPDAPELG